MRFRPLALCLVLAASTALAQVSQPEPPPIGGPQISITFKGGTVEEYLQSLRAAAPKDTPVNIVASLELQSVQIPPVKLTNTSTYAALSALTVLVPREEFNVNVKALSAIGQSAAESNSFAVESARSRSRPSEDRQSLRVFSVRDLMAETDDEHSERMKPQTLLTAIQSALAETPDVTTPPAEVKFHPESGLIIIRGSGAELDAVSQVLNEVRTAAKNEQAADRIAAARKLDTVRADQRVMMATKTLENLRRRLGQTLELQKAGSVPAGEVLGMELEVSRAEGELTIAHAEREAIAEGVTFTSPMAGDQSDLLKRLAMLEQTIAELRSQLNQSGASKGGKPPASTR